MFGLALEGTEGGFELGIYRNNLKEQCQHNVSKWKAAHSGLVDLQVFILNHTTSCR